MFLKKSLDKPAFPARERIMRAAHELFYREGIRATGIDRIIAESGVAKATFYRHFLSKNDLVKAYLKYRHEVWIAWFIDALNRHKDGRRHPLDALMLALEEWFQSNGYRGCAFINAVVEIDKELPEVVAISRRHKEDMVKVIVSILPVSEHRERDAQVVAMAVDGAIVRAIMDESSDTSLKILDSLLRLLQLNTLSR